MDNLKISAVIPAYNSALFLPLAIKSILRQTYPVDEIIVVDDGSTDATQEVLRNFENKITYIYQSNAGPSSARNKGIEYAKGDWIAFLDADDLWISRKIDIQMKLLKINPELALIAGDMAEITPDMEILVPSVLKKHGLKSLFANNQKLLVPNAMDVLLNKNFIPTGTVLVKKDVLHNAGGFNPKIRYGEDLELWAKISATNPIGFIPDVLMLRTLHKDNATSATENMLRDLVRVMISLKEWATSNKIQTDADLDFYVSRAWADLGYSNFSMGFLKKSRRYFLKSYIANPSLRAFIYYAASFLTPKMIEWVKSVKALFQVPNIKKKQ